MRHWLPILIAFVAGTATTMLVKRWLRRNYGRDRAERRDMKTSAERAEVRELERMARL